MRGRDSREHAKPQSEYAVRVRVSQHAGEWRWCWECLSPGCGEAHDRIITFGDAEDEANAHYKLWHTSDPVAPACKH